MKRRAILIVLMFALMGLTMAVENIPGKDQTGPSLNEILAKSAAYCRRLAGASLHFVSQEQITEQIYFPFLRKPAPMGGQYATTGRLQLVYDFQLIQKENAIREQRILLAEGGKKTEQKDAPLKVRRFRYQNIILGPIGLLSDYWQTRYDYRIFGRDKIKGEKIVIIEAHPKLGLELEYLYGKVWVSESDGSALKIEWNQKSMKNFDAIEKTARDLKAEPRIKLTLECAFEKNRLRFPSRYRVSEQYVGQRGVVYHVSELDVRYADYKFFVVETHVDYR